MTTTEDRYRSLLDASSTLAEQPTVKAVLHSLRDVLSSSSRLHDTPKALRAWAPRSSKTSMNNSEAPFATTWGSVKCGPLLTKTKSFTIRRRSFRSPMAA